MKKLIIVILAIAMLVPTICSAEGDLHKVQNYIFTHSPMDMDERKFELSGEIVDVHSINVNTHWDMIVKSYDETAAKPFWSDYPYFIAHFRLHLEECPFNVGDTVTIVGSVNSIYSSHAIPYIIVQTINGSDEF